MIFSLQSILIVGPFHTQRYTIGAKKSFQLLHLLKGSVVFKHTDIEVLKDYLRHMSGMQFFMLTTKSHKGIPIKENSLESAWEPAKMVNIFIVSSPIRKDLLNSFINALI